MDITGAAGRKVFFLYPPAVLESVAGELARREFEVYLVKDHERLRKVLETSPMAILFANIDEGMDEPAWETYLKGLRATTPLLGLGVVSLNDDQSLKQKYLLEMGLECGFITLKNGIAQATDILLKTLDAVEARGRRRFVRSACQPGTGRCIVPVGDRTVEAEITDFSAAGIALRSADGLDLRVGTVLRSLVLIIRGSRIGIDGFVATRREGQPGTYYVIMFDPASLDDARKEKLHDLVFRSNQMAMARLLAVG